MLVLGHHLASELGFADSCDTLGKWMAHHLAELMTLAEDEKEAEKKAVYQHQAVELILKIWVHRSSLDRDAYPLARFKDIINVMGLLSPDVSPWERNKLGKYETLANESYGMLCDLYRSFLFINLVNLKSNRNKHVPASVLSDDEQTIFETLLSWTEGVLNDRASTRSSESGSEHQLAVDGVCQLIDDLSEKLGKLKSTILSNEPKAGR